VTPEEIAAINKMVTDTAEAKNAIARERWRNIVFHTIELYGGARCALIEPVVLERLAAYRDHGQPVGNFLQAVIANDLQAALSRADEYNRATLFHLVAWMYNEFSSKLWGSREIYTEHLESKRLERERLERNNPAEAKLLGGGGVGHSCLSPIR
jgi:hypothetical protein